MRHNSSFQLAAPSPRAGRVHERRATPLRALAILALLPATACGFIQIETRGLNGITSGGGSAGESHAANAGDLEKSVAETYAKWTWESCKNFECVNAFQKAAGVSSFSDKGGYVFKYNPRNGKNPDPAWLTGWDKLSNDEHANTADETYQALVLAAAQKSWIARCHADYDKIDPGLRESDAKLSGAVTKAKAIKDPYAKIAALLALRETAPKAAKDDTVGRLTATVGARVELEAAIQDAFKESGREYLYWVQGHQPDDSFMSGYRARRSKEDERDLYCSRSIHGNELTPELTQDSGYLSKGAIAVKPLFSDEELKKLDRDVWAREGKERFRSKERWSLPWLSEAVDGGKDGLPGMPKVGRFGGLPIKSITKGADGTVLELYEKYDSEYAYDCVDTNRVTGVDSNGRFIYQSICKTGKTITEKSAKLVVKELPEGLELKAGDVLDVIVKGSKHEKKDVLKTKPLEKTQETWEGEVLHVERVTREKKVVGAWFKR